MILFADTETTGIALFRSPPDDPNQPRIVQLGAILCDDSRRVVAEMNFLVKSAGRYGDFKWPSLKETYAHFFGREFDGAHDAMADVRACRDVYWAMNPPVATPAGTPTMEVE